MSGNDSGNVPAGTPQRQRLSHLQPQLRALSQSSQSRPQDVTPGPSTTRPPNPSFRTLPFSFFLTSLIICVSYSRKEKGEKKKKGLPYLIPTHTLFFPSPWWRSPGLYTAQRPLCVVMPELAFTCPNPRGLLPDSFFVFPFCVCFSALS